jgi:CRP-like cAMP-binding protein
VATTGIFRYAAGSGHLRSRRHADPCLFPHLSNSRVKPTRLRECALADGEIAEGIAHSAVFERSACLATAKNHLIELLPRKDRQRLLELTEHVQLVQSEVLSEVGKPIRHIYFPVNGFISLVTSIDRKPVLEVGMVGREGLLGAQVALGVPIQPMHALVQGPGSALRLGLKVFREELGRNAALKRLLDRYIYVLMSQLASSAACTRFHRIDARLSRWLLMMQDRAHADTFGVTQEFLSFMLGVRRAGINAAAAALQHQGLIEYRRGQVKVLNPRRLENTACSCYSDDNQVYARVMH